MAKVSIGDSARSVLESIRSDGRQSNLSKLATRSGLDQDTFQVALAELERNSLIARQGMRVSLTNIGKVSATSRAGQRTNREPRLSEAASLFFGRLPTDGSSIGNLRLRSILPLTDEQYKAAKTELLLAMLIKKGAGQGGSVARLILDVNSDKRPRPLVAATPARHLVAKEADLYEPFVTWLRSNTDTDDVAFFEVGDTSSGRARRRSSGQWSRPDVTSIQVLRHEWLPEVTVEVSTYEVKRSGELQRLEAVYEAAAHSRWSHRASLVLEQGQNGELPPDNVLAEIERFGLGLYYMVASAGGNHHDVSMQMTPAPKSPEPELLNEIIAYFFHRRPAKSDSYRQTIGR